MRSLRKQLICSHLALVALMALVMTGAVINFFRLGLSIDRILKDNYKSVVAAQSMKDSLERIDSSAQFSLANEPGRARKQYQDYRARFKLALKDEQSNITEQGEEKVAAIIEGDFKTYSFNVEKLLDGPQQPDATRRAFYFTTLEPQFRGLKKNAQQVLDINQAAIVRANNRAKREAQRGTSIGIGMLLAALVLAILFARAAINASLTPLLALAQGAEEIGAGHLNRRIELQRSDEIGILAVAFNSMAEKLREARRIEQQRLHRAQQMSDAALESLYDPVIVTDATGTVVHLNHAAEELFGPATQASGQPVARVVGEERIARAVERVIRQEHVTAEEGEAAFVPLVAGAAQRTYRLRATPMRDDDTTLLGAALVLEDVTHLHELSRLKSEFIGVASHELRTPVTSLLLSVQLLQEGAAGTLSEAQQEIVAAQREDLERLDQLMHDLLDITRLETGTLPPRMESVPVAELIAAAQTAVGAVANAKGVELAVADGAGLPAVRIDRAQITRVLINLLNNAIRHTPAGGRVKIGASARVGKVHFSIEDTGEGIPAEYLSRIFSRFVQVPGATRGGVGLGLSIAQTIIRAHGEEIRAASDMGKGSAFSFDLPLASTKHE